MIILKEKVAEVKNEDLTSQIDGIQTVFTIANNFISTSLISHLSGLLQREGAGNDYTITASNQITFNKAPKVGMTLIVSYIID